MAVFGLTAQYCDLEGIDIKKPTFDCPECGEHTTYEFFQPVTAPDPRLEPTSPGGFMCESCEVLIPYEDIDYE